MLIRARTLNRSNMVYKNNFIIADGTNRVDRKCERRQAEI